MAEENSHEGTLQCMLRQNNSQLIGPIMRKQATGLHNVSMLAENDVFQDS